jgi:hypothetical protein
MDRGLSKVVDLWKEWIVLPVQKGLYKGKRQRRVDCSERVDGSATAKINGETTSRCRINDSEMGRRQIGRIWGEECRAQQWRVEEV